MKPEYMKSKGMFQEGEKAYLGYKSLVFSVRKVDKTVAHAETLQGGNVQPGSVLFVPTTRKAASLRDLLKIKPENLILLNPDYIMLPAFTREKELNLITKQIDRFKEKRPWVICKISTKEAYESSDNIIKRFHGIVISRRELAFSLNPATVPMITKELINKCSQMSKNS